MISGILLAGGKSSRMGREKALIEFNGQKLYRYPLQVLEHFCNDIIISTASGSLRNEIQYPAIADEQPGLGPMGGIYTCLKSIKNDRAIVLSCDIPNISIPYIDYLLNSGNEPDIICGRNPAGFPEPLAGIYHKKVLPKIEQCIAGHDLKMGLLLEKADAMIIDLPEEKFNAGNLFKNVNRQEDL